jgi:hypothetical protein
MEREHRPDPERGPDAGPGDPPPATSEPADESEFEGAVARYVRLNLPSALWFLAALGILIVITLALAQFSLEE